MMSYSKNKFNVVYTDLELASLEVLYAIGREYKLLGHSNDAIGDFYSVSTGSIEVFIKPLYKYLNEQMKFTPLFIELSLSDPLDEKGNTFYTFLFSKRDSFFALYLEEMKKNAIKTSLRGPIIPNKRFYEASFYSFFSEQESVFYDDPLKEFSVMVGSFNFGKEECNSSRDIVKKNVRTFLSSCFDRFSKNMKTVGEKRLNYAIVMPIFRPPSLNFTMDSIFFGGGIFLFGHIGPDFEEKKLIRNMNDFFSKSALSTSQNQIEMSLLKEKQMNIELSLFHHFGSNLRNIENMLGADDLSVSYLNKGQARIISLVQNYLRGLLGNTQRLLKAYSSYISQSKKKEVKLKELFEQLEALKQDARSRGFGFSVIIEEGEWAENISIDPFVFRGVLDQLIGNTLKEYKGLGVPYEEINILFRVKRKEKAVMFTMFSADTYMSEYHISRVGFKPVNSVTSSGLGFYFLNIILKISGASVYNDGKFFQIKNMKNPYGLRVSFLYKLWN